MATQFSFFVCCCCFLFLRCYLYFSHLLRGGFLGGGVLKGFNSPLWPPWPLLHNLKKRENLAVAYNFPYLWLLSFPTMLLSLSLSLSLSQFYHFHCQFSPSLNSLFLFLSVLSFTFIHLSVTSFLFHVLPCPLIIFSFISLHLLSSLSLLLSNSFHQSALSKYLTLILSLPVNHYLSKPFFLPLSFIALSLLSIL